MSIIKPHAKVVCDSVAAGHRITTMVVRMHRFVLAEFNTHCAFARNSASSRAIPMDKAREMVEKNPAFPMEWGKNQSGMQAKELLTGQELASAVFEWKEAMACMLTFHRSEQLNNLHKQLTNRLIELWGWHTAVVTFHQTGLENFFYQRCNADAQPEMKAAADAMQLAYYTSKPKELGAYEWHLPFVLDGEVELNGLDFMKKVSAARCARVSYLQHDGTRDLQKDLDLYERLTAPGAGHWSPLEHVCTPLRTRPEWQEQGNGHLVRKFPGWVQLRHMVEPEHKPFIPNHPELVMIASKMSADLNQPMPPLCHSHISLADLKD